MNRISDIYIIYFSLHTFSQVYAEILFFPVNFRMLYEGNDSIQYSILKQKRKNFSRRVAGYNYELCILRLLIITLLAPKNINTIETIL
jgi:hypothetical protein